MFKEKYLISKEKSDSDIKLTTTGSSITPGRSELVSSEPEKLTDSLATKRQDQATDLAGEMLADDKKIQVEEALESYLAKDTSGKSAFEKLFGDENLALTFNFAHAIESHIRAKLTKGFIFIGPNPENDGLTWLWEKNGVEIEEPLPILNEKYEDQTWGDLLNEKAKKQYEKLPSKSILAERFAQKFINENLAPYLKKQRPNLTLKQIIQSPLVEEIKRKIIHGYNQDDPFILETSADKIILKNEKERKTVDLNDYDDTLKPYPNNLDGKIDRIIEQKFLNPLRKYLRNKFQILANEFAQDDGDEAPSGFYGELITAINEKQPESEIARLIEDIIWDSDLVEDLKIALKAGLESGKPLKINFAGENFTLNNDSSLFSHKLANLHFDLDNDYDENLKRNGEKQALSNQNMTDLLSQNPELADVAKEIELKGYTRGKFPEESKALMDFLGKYKENPPKTVEQKKQFINEALQNVQDLLLCDLTMSSIYAEHKSVFTNILSELDSSGKVNPESIETLDGLAIFADAIQDGEQDSPNRSPQALASMYQQYAQFISSFLK